MITGSGVAFTQKMFVAMAPLLSFPVYVISDLQPFSGLSPEYFVFSLVWMTYDFFPVSSVTQSFPTLRIVPLTVFLSSCASLTIFISIARGDSSSFPLYETLTLSPMNTYLETPVTAVVLSIVNLYDVAESMAIRMVVSVNSETIPLNVFTSGFSFSAVTETLLA